MRTVKIGKAAGLEGNDIAGVTIVIDEVVNPRPDDLRDQYEHFEQQGSLLEFFLHKTLPGGTYDQLAAAILRRIASQLRVSHEREATNA